MGITTFISIFALIVSVFATWYTKQQFSESKKANNLLEQQIKEDNAPQFSYGRKTCRNFGSKHAKYALQNIGGSPAINVQIYLKNTTPQVSDVIRIQSYKIIPPAGNILEDYITYEDNKSNHYKYSFSELKNGDEVLDQHIWGFDLHNSK